MSKYEEPFWSGPPGEDAQRSADCVRNGKLVQTLDLADRGCYLVGRQPDVCQIPLEHASISRQHAVLQHRPSTGAFYLYDLGSTHGSFVNKQQVQPNVYVPLKDGDFLRFGASSRMFFIAMKGGDRRRPPAPTGEPESTSAPTESAPPLQTSPPSSSSPPPPRNDNNGDSADLAPTASPAETVQSQDDDKPPTVFEGNPEEFKAFLDRAKRMGGREKKKLAALKRAGFDQRDLSEKATFGGLEAQNPKKAKRGTDFDEVKGTFGVWKSRHSADGDDDPHGQQDDDYEDDGDNEGEAPEGGEIGARRFLGLEHQADTGFDSDDDFFDRTDAKKGSSNNSFRHRKGDGSGTGSVPLTLLDLQIRLAGLTGLADEVKEELTWFLRNVYQGGDDRVFIEQAMAEDEFDAYMTGMLGDVKKDIKQRFLSLTSDLKKEIDASNKMIKLVTPALPEPMTAAEKRLIHDEKAWAQDDLIREFAVRLQQICTAYTRDPRTKRRRQRPAATSGHPELGSTGPPKPPATFTREQLDAEEGGGESQKKRKLDELAPANEQPRQLNTSSKEAEKEEEKEVKIAAVETVDSVKKPRTQQPAKKKKPRKKAKAVPQYDELDEWGGGGGSEFAL